MSQQTTSRLRECEETLNEAINIIEQFIEYDFALDNYLHPLEAQAKILLLAVKAQRDLIKETQ